MDLETQISFEVLCNFTDKTLEWQFADEQFRGLLVAPNFTEGDGS
jgi:hypothetical protein